MREPSTRVTRTCDGPHGANIHHRGMNDLSDNPRENRRPVGPQEGPSSPWRLPWSEWKAAFRARIREFQEDLRGFQAQSIAGGPDASCAISTTRSAARWADAASTTAA